jgi:hypothetical protein
MTTSRIGIIGNLRVSDFSFEESILESGRIAELPTVDA